MNVDSLSNTSAPSRIPGKKKEEDLSDAEVGATDQDDEEEEDYEEKDVPDTESVKQRLLSNEGGYGSTGKKDKKAEEDEKSKKGRGLDFKRMVALAKPEKWCVSLKHLYVLYSLLVPPSPLRLCLHVLAQSLFFLCECMSTTSASLSLTHPALRYLFFGTITLFLGNGALLTIPYIVGQIINATTSMAPEEGKVRVRACVLNGGCVCVCVIVGSR